MTLGGSVQILIFFVLLILAVKPLGGYMARVYSGDRTFLSPVLGSLENRFYRISGVQPDKEMNWKTYGLAVLAISIVGNRVPLCATTVSASAAAQSARLWPGSPRPGVQYSCQFCHQYQLAELWW